MEGRKDCRTVRREKELLGKSVEKKKKVGFNTIGKIREKRLRLKQGKEARMRK